MRWRKSGQDKSEAESGKIKSASMRKTVEMLGNKKRKIEAERIAAKPFPLALGTTLIFIFSHSAFLHLWRGELTGDSLHGFPL